MPKSNRTNSYIIKNIFISIIIAGIISLTAILINNISFPKQAELIAFVSGFVTAVGNIYAIVAGFTILIAFTRYQNLNNVVGQEVGCLGDIMDLTLYISNADLRNRIINNVKKYGYSVANDEWPQMINGKPNKKTSVVLRDLMESLDGMNINKKDRDSIIFESFLDRVKDLTTYRANRLKEAQESFPSC